MSNNICFYKAETFGFIIKHQTQSENYFFPNTWLLKSRQKWRIQFAIIGKSTAFCITMVTICRPFFSIFINPNGGKPYGRCKFYGEADLISFFQMATSSGWPLGIVRGWSDQHVKSNRGNNITGWKENAINFYISLSITNVQLAVRRS